MQDHATATSSVPTAGEGTRMFRGVCDQCRMRKIRCSRVHPCSNCIVAKRVCAFTGAGRRAKTPPQQTAEQPRYDHNRITDVESRLSSVETLLRDIYGRLASAPTMQPSPCEPDISRHVQQSGSNLTVTASPASAPDTTASSLSNDPILAQQRTFARDFVQNALRDPSLSDISLQMQSALSDLRQIVELQNSHSKHDGINLPLAQPIPQGGLRELPMPPLNKVVSLWTQLQDSPPTVSMSLCSLVGVSDFPSLCRVVYFPSADFSDATFAAVNLCLYYMFSERDTLIVQGDLQEECRSYITMCQQNVETSLSNLRVFSITTVDSLVALILGTIYAIDHSIPAVAWTLNCAAAQICQTAGFRIPPYTGTSISDQGGEPGLDAKSVALWHVYTMDRALGLRLGRAPILQDWDIAMPHDMHFRGVVGLSGMPTTWFKLATLQGKIYRHLYSTSALVSPSTDLIDRARALAEECRALEVETANKRSEAVALFEKMKASPLISSLVRSDEVQLLATLTLVYRAIPPADGDVGTFSRECLMTARKSMGKHQECMGMLNNQLFIKRSYAHWNLLLLPFTPFFVLFCSVIETSSEADLQLVQGFASSLQQLSEVSPTMEKLWHLCSVMSNVAAMYVETKRLRVGENLRPCGNEFDEYLAQLGFINGEMPEDIGEDVGQWNVQAFQYNDWFSKSRDMMDLLQQDLSDLGA